MRRGLRPLEKLALVIGLALPMRWAGGESPAPVTVTNFPPVQSVTGGVAITEPVPQTRFLVRRALVAPAALQDTTHLTDGGVFESERFPFVTLSLGGGLQGRGQPGVVGVVLIPDLPEVTEAFRDFGVLQFPLRLEAPVASSEAGLFSSESATFRLAFPRYRVLFFNTTPKSADATLYVLFSTS
jgi:hypothetical protein